MIERLCRSAKTRLARAMMERWLDSVFCGTAKRRASSPAAKSMRFVFDQQSEGLQPGFLGESGEDHNGGFLFHISRILDESTPSIARR